MRPARLPVTPLRDVHARRPAGNRAAGSAAFPSQELRAHVALWKGSMWTIRNGIMWLRRAAIADRWALVPLRLVVGFGFAAHGYAKLARGPESFAAILSAIGVPAPHLAAWATVAVELLGGVAMMAGAGVVVMTPLLAAIMVTALFGVHLRYGF